MLWSLLGNSGKTQILNLVGELLGTDKIDEHSYPADERGIQVYPGEHRRETPDKY
ncbi:MAG: hypothetical protein ACLR0U_15925 [Enterocloster clostridioformis]